MIGILEELRSYIPETPKGYPPEEPTGRQLGRIMRFALEKQAERSLLEVLLKFATSSRVPASAECDFFFMSERESDSERTVVLGRKRSVILPAGSFLATCFWKKDGTIFMKKDKLQQHWAFIWKPEETRWALIEGDASQYPL